MRTPSTVRSLSLLTGPIAALCLLASDPAAALTPAEERGKYIMHAAGCFACHTDEKSGTPALSGGPPLQTPFGVFYAPNITPDPIFGIGRWTGEQFVRAMRSGVGPDGKDYYPVFPYTSYSKASTEDLLDLRAYLLTVPPVRRPNRTHELSFPVSLRLTMLPWKWLNFDSSPWKPDARQDAAWNRGSYLVEALLHCGECHTPRTLMGAMDRSQWMAGARLGTEDNVAPNITSHREGIADWSPDDIAFSLEQGITPHGGAFSKEMAEVVKHGTSHLSKNDRDAVATYIKSLPPLPSAVRPNKR